SAIAKDFAVLSSSAASDADKAASLKFLGHWVGDVHQPLHVSFEDDRGGNEINVVGDCRGNLHSAWDTCLVVEALKRRQLNFQQRLRRNRSKHGRNQNLRTGQTKPSRSPRARRPNTASSTATGATSPTSECGSIRPTSTPTCRS